MPSACTKPENKASLASNEVESPIKQAINICDKKVRNLEKRKGKLDVYRENAAKGKTLNEDQLEAVGRYEVVLQTLEFAREIQKQFIAIQGEAEKLMKKQMKRESHERQQLEIRRIKELLAVQNLLDSLGDEDVRADFVGGSQGAVKLTVEELDKLDELYKLISPTRDDENNYTEQLVTASEHIVNFLDAREKEVIGTTYKELKAIVEKINECGYFDSKGEEKASTEEVVAAVAEAEETEDCEQQATAAAVTEEEEVEEEKEQEQPPIAATEDFSAQSQQSVTTTLVESQPEQPTATTAPLDFGLGGESTVAAVMLSQQQAPPEMINDEETFFSTQPFPEPRPFNEIVSSVQGNFNFLQDSEIEQQAKAAAAAQQLDPAVVAAQMTGTESSASTATSSLSFQPQEQYQTQDVPSVEDPLASSSGNTGLSFTQDLQTTSHQMEPTFDDQTIYAQSLMTQGLQSSGSGQYDGSNSNQTQSSGTDSGYGAAEQASFGQMEGPPQPIPMPGQYGDQSAQSEEQAAADKSKKQFAMNPNADIFQSMYTGGGSGGGSSGGGSAAGQQGGRPDQYGQQQQQGGNTWGIQQSDYQQQGYGGGGQYRRGGPQQQQSGGGGYRGGQGQQRNGGGGAGSMSNGYRAGGSRGGAPGGNSRGGRPAGGAYNAGGSGGRGAGMQQQQQQQQSRGTGGNGGAYKGYPPRNDYQPEGGYQGYNNGFMSAAAVAQGGPRGGPRGGATRGGRGGSYANRMA